MRLIQRTRVTLLQILWCAALLAAVDCACAQQAPVNTNQQAREMAQKLGHERSAEGLETIIATGNTELFAAYEHGFRETSMRLFRENKNTPRPLPADIEALIVKHYADPKIGGALRGLVAQNGTKYQTRTLFDLMYAEWRSGKVRASSRSLRDSVLATDVAGIEAPLLDLLQSLQQQGDASDGERIVAFLGERKYQPAAPMLAARIRDAKPGNLSYGALHALAKIAPSDAIGTGLQRLTWLRDQPSGPEVAREIDALIAWIAQLPADMPVDFAAFKKAMPATLSDPAKSSLLGFIAKRKEEAGVPDVLRLLGETKFYPRTLEILIAFDSPEIWKQTRAEVERLKQQGVLNDGQYRFSSSVLDQKIANPEKHFAESKQRERQREFDARKSALYAKKNELQKLKDGPPEPYLFAYADYLKSQERLAEEYSDLGHAVGLRTEIGNEYLNLGHLLRFRLKQSRRALEAYAKVEQLGVGMGSFSTADTYQFDLRDTAAALEVYARMLQQMRQAPGSHNNLEASIATWGRSWLTHQIEYLKTGRRFNGTIGQEDLSGAALLLYVPSSDDTFDLAPFHRALTDAPRAGSIDRNAVAKKLDSLPASGWTLLRTMPLVTVLPDADAILRYLARHDPAGYASACFFALVDALAGNAEASRQAAQMLPGLGMPPAGSANPLRVATARFLKERNVSLNTRPDPRMASPEKTWNLFIASLKSGDIDTAMACLTPGMQGRLRPLFTQLPADRLRAMAESFSGFSMSKSMGGGIGEAVVVRGKQAGMVYFVDSGGAWKIDEM